MTTTRALGLLAPIVKFEQAIVPAATIFACFTGLPAQTEARTAIAALHAGDPDALSMVHRCGDPGLRALLGDLRTRLDEGDRRRASADLEALRELRTGKGFVIADLLALHEDLPRELYPGQRVRVLHTLADLALWSDDDGATLVETWLEGNPRSAFDRELEAREFERFYFAEERERVRARFEVRRIDDVERLEGLLVAADLDVAEAAAEKLARQGPLRAPALRQLTLLMDAQPAQVERILVFNGENTEGRIPLRHGLAAARAIVAVAPESPAALAAHGRILELGGRDERIRSAVALRSCAEVPTAVLAQLTRAAEQRQVGPLRREAILTLIALSSDPAQVRTLLEGVVADAGDPRLVEVARGYLARAPGDSAEATAPDSEFYVVIVDGQRGFIDATGELVIQPTFDHAYPFREGLAAVQVGQAWGYIDRRGRMVIEPRFAVAGFFSEGLASFRREFHEPWGYIDTRGEVIIEPRFDTADEFRTGVAQVGIETEHSKKESFRADVGIQVSHRFINRRGDFVPAPDPMLFATGAPDERVLFQRRGLWGFLGADGEVAVEPRFVSARPFSDGLACVRLDGPFGYIDKTGRFVIEPQFPYANPFAEGLAGVMLGDKGWGFIDTAGDVVIEPRFNWIYSGFRQGLAEVVVDGAVGYIDKSRALDLGADEVADMELAEGRRLREGDAALMRHEAAGRPGLRAVGTASIGRPCREHTTHRTGQTVVQVVGDAECVLGQCTEFAAEPASRLGAQVAQRRESGRNWGRGSDRALPLGVSVDCHPILRVRGVGLHRRDHGPGQSRGQGDGADQPRHPVPQRGAGGVTCGQVAECEIECRCRLCRGRPG